MRIEIESIKSMWEKFRDRKTKITKYNSPSIEKIIV